MQTFPRDKNICTTYKYASTIIDAPNMVDSTTWHHSLGTTLSVVIKLNSSSPIIVQHVTLWHYSVHSLHCGS